MSGIVCTPALANSVACFERASSIQPTDLLSGMQQTGPDREPQSAGFEISTLTSYLQTALVSTALVQVGDDHRLYGNDGNRLYLRGVQVYNNCFALFSDGYRFDWFIRYSQDPNNIPSYSQPIKEAGGQTWLATTYVDDATSRAFMISLKAKGFNCFRIWVGIGMVQTIAYTDALTGLSFPPELEILDKIVLVAAQLGMYVWMSYAQGSAPNDKAAEFWGIMAARYRVSSNVIFDLENEPGSGIVYVDPNNPTQSSPYSALMPTLADWTARFSALLAAIRDAGFLGPCAVQTFQNIDAVDTITAALANPPFSTDPNLLVAPHIYYTFRDVPTAFSTTEPVLNTHVYNYARYFCLVAGEFGFTNDFPFSDPTAAIAWNKSAAGWLQQEGMNGAVFFTMPPNHDALNYIVDATTGDLTTWGDIVTEYNTDASQSLCQLIPVITSTGGNLTDTTGSSITFRRVGERVDVNLNVVIVTNGTASGVLLVQMPAQAPTDSFQTYQGFLSTSGAPGAAALILIQVYGYYAQITNLDGTYPGADGNIVQASFTYYAQGQTFGLAYSTQTFDTTYWLVRGGNLTGIADGQAGTCAFTIAMTGGDGIQQDIITTQNQRFAIIRNASNQIQIQLRNSSNTVIGSMVSNPLIVADGTKWAFLCAWDLSTTIPTIRMFINGVGNGTVTVNTNDTIDYTDANVGVGGSVAGGSLLQATMDFLWFHPTYLEPANQTNYGAFFDYKSNPVDLGMYGDKPLFVLGGSLPILFMRQTTTGPTSFYVNRGTGGGFTKHP